MRLNEPEMTATKRRNYLESNIIKNAEKRRRQVIAQKSAATKKFQAGKISKNEKDIIHSQTDKFRQELNDYINHYKFKSKAIKGYGNKRSQRGRGAYFFNDAKEMLKKLTVIIGEMEAGNNSIEMSKVS